VITPKGTEVRDIVVGQSNDTKAEIREGLKEGDVVVLNPRAILGDNAKVRQPGQGQADKGGDEGDSGRGKGKGKADKARPKNGKEGGRQFNPDEVAERFRKAKPEGRKKMLEQVPEGYRGNLRQMLKGKGIDVP
jgi:hypothetical protein